MLVEHFGGLGRVRVYLSKCSSEPTKSSFMELFVDFPVPLSCQATSIKDF